jgi:hypothetical protein
MYNIALVYIDDTCVFGNTVEEYLYNLRLVFMRFTEYNVRLKPEKCSFGVEEFQFVGHVFNADGYHLSNERKQGIQDLKAPTNLKQLRSFLGMVNYFRDFIPNLSSELSNLTALTTKDTPYIWSPIINDTFLHIKELIWSSARLNHLNDTGDITLYTDASGTGIGAVLVQKSMTDNIDYPILFISHKFGDAAQKWSTIEQECYSIYYSVIHLQSYLLGRHFFIATDHRNLMFLEKSIVPKLVRWRLRLLEFKYTVKHVPGIVNVVADQLSRLNIIYASINRMVSIDGVEVDNTDLFNTYHNDIVGHHGVNQTCKLIQRANKTWTGYHNDIRGFIRNCHICQKIKFQTIPQVITNKYHLHGEYPMRDISVDTIGPLPDDEHGNKYILVIIDNFSKFTELYATRDTTAISYVQACLQHISLFGIMSSIRSDGGTQFTANICKQLSELFGFTHHIILAYHPQANGIVERKNAEVIKHLKSLVLVKHDKDKWSMYLPLVQRILNSTIDTNTSICPSEIIFGNQLPIMTPLLADNNDTTLSTTSVHDYIHQISDAMSILVTRSRIHLENISISPDIDASQGHQYNVGDYVLLTYPSQPPHKLSPAYRGPLKIVSQVRDDIYTLLDMITGKHKNYHVDRLRIFNNDDNTDDTSLLTIIAADNDEYMVEFIVEHMGSIKKKNQIQFRIRWKGYDEQDDTWLYYAKVKDLQALDTYIMDHPELADI